MENLSSNCSGVRPEIGSMLADMARIWGGKDNYYLLLMEGTKDRNQNNDTYESKNRDFEDKDEDIYLSTNFDSKLYKEMKNLFGATVKFLSLSSMIKPITISKK